MASHEERKTFLDVVCRTAEQVFMPLTVGGGVQTLDDIRDLLRAGADKVSINTAAVANPEFVRQAAERFGTQCIVVAIDAKRAGIDAKRAGADAKRAGGGWEGYTHGGRRPTGLDAVEWARRMASFGAGGILLTSLDQDGAKGGYELGLTGRRSGGVGIPGVASGGAG